MAKRYASDFERGYDYARRRYGELAGGFSPQALLDLAAVLRRVAGGDAELARGIAAGISELVRANKAGGQK